MFLLYISESYLLRLNTVKIKFPPLPSTCRNLHYRGFLALIRRNVFFFYFSIDSGIKKLQSPEL